MSRISWRCTPFYYNKWWNRSTGRSGGRDRKLPVQIKKKNKVLIEGRRQPTNSDEFPSKSRVYIPSNWHYSRCGCFLKAEYHKNSGNMNELNGWIQVQDEEARRLRNDLFSWMIFFHIEEEGNGHHLSFYFLILLIQLYTKSLIITCKKLIYKCILERFNYCKEMMNYVLGESNEPLMHGFLNKWEQFVRWFVENNNYEDNCG